MRSLFNRIRSAKQVKRSLKKAVGNPVVVSGVVGAAAFVIIFGLQVLNPTNDSWMYSEGGDLAQHQLGWQFFRDSPWSIPLGYTKNLMYPQGTSVVFTDSIPLFAIPAKAVSALLPEHFQYFGLWGLSCFVLQGVFAALLVSKFTKRKWLIVVSSIFFIFSPPLLFRIYMHTSLAAHWIILVALNIVVRFKDYGLSKRAVAYWAIVMSLATTIHLYFVPMVFVLMLVYMTLTVKKFRQLVFFAIPPALSVIVLWLIGGLATSSYAGGSMGEYGADLNTFINPLGYSALLPSMPIAPFAYEGLSYLGLGVILLAIPTIGTLIWYPWINEKSKWRKLTRGVLRSRRFMISAGLILLLTAFGIGTSLYAQGHLILSIPLPHRVESLLSIYRSTGRFVWVAHYCTVLLFVIVVAKHYETRAFKNRARKYGMFVFVALLAALQIVDVWLSPALQAKVKIINHQQPVSALLLNKGLADMMERNTHIVSLDEAMTPAEFARVGVVAASFDMTMNDGYVARKNEPEKITEITAAKKQVLDGRPDSQTVYISTDEVTRVQLNRLASTKKVTIIQSEGISFYDF